MYRKWNANPVTIVYGSELLPVLTIPFPAITICSLSKSRSDIFNLTWALDVKHKNLTSLNKDSERKLRALAHVCPFQKYWKTFSESKHEHVVEDLRSLAHTLEHVMIKCSWRSKFVPCKNIMIERLVDDGVCFTFNSLAPEEIYRKDLISPDFINLTNTLPPSDWSRENGYRHGAGLNAYPYRSVSNGKVSGIIFAISFGKNDQAAMCQGTRTGFKFSIHAPDEIPLTEDRFYRFNSMSAAIVNVIPEVFRASDGLRSVNPFKRNCFFSNERPLRFFKQYNQFNCAVECIANYTLAKCGCVKFSMPRFRETKICDASRIDCYRNAFLALYEIAIRASLTGKSIRTCQCLPACTSVDYPIGLTQVPFYDLPINLSFVRENEHPGLIFVSLKDRHYFPMWRRELVGVNQAIAQLGGLFALLMGSSMLSLAEVVYYCCVRRLRRERIRQSRMTYPRSCGHRIHRRVDPWAKHQHCRGFIAN